MTSFDSWRQFAGLTMHKLIILLIQSFLNSRNFLIYKEDFFVMLFTVQQQVSLFFLPIFF